jgi:hypothetical protein
MEDLPSGYGIDPATGQICAGDPSIILHTNVKMGDKKKAFMAAVSKVRLVVFRVRLETVAFMLLWFSILCLVCHR